MSDKYVRINHTWIITDIDDCIIDRKSRRSAIFTTSNSKSSWRLSLDVIYKNDLYFFTLYLKNCSDLDVPSGQKITFTIIRPLEGKVFSRSQIITEENELPPMALLPLYELQGFMYRGTLTILCEVTEPGYLDVNEKSIYEPLLNDKTFSDVNIIVGNEKFSVHKVILITNSRVFRNMFLNPMEESVSNEIKIKDMDSEIFQELLSYMYAGKVKDLEEQAQEILIAANRYEIDGLKFICERMLYTKLTLENVINFMTFADKYNAIFLKDYCFAFIIKEYKNIIELDDFKEIVRSNVELWIELSIQIGQKYKFVVK